jgi:hypothetical protein
MGRRHRSLNTTEIFVDAKQYGVKHAKGSEHHSAK